MSNVIDSLNVVVEKIEIKRRTRGTFKIKLTEVRWSPKKRCAWEKMESVAVFTPAVGAELQAFLAAEQAELKAVGERLRAAWLAYSAA